MKILFLISLSLVAMTSQAQMQVNSGGNVAIKTTLEPKSLLSVNTAGDMRYGISVVGLRHGIYAEASNQGIFPEFENSWKYGGYMKVPVIDSYFNVGLFGNATATNGIEHTTGRSFGVFGMGGHSTSGYNYGVFGRLAGTGNGAGIYGTATVNDNGIYLSKRYAGYFNGNVAISGSLTVNGAISSLVLGSTAPNPGHTEYAINTMSANGANSASAGNAAERMSGLSAVSFYKEVPMRAKAQQADSVAETRTVGTIEQQDLSKQHYALSAEALEASFPELVYQNEDGTKAINYMEMIPLLVQSINELNAKIAFLEGGGMARAAQCGTAGIDNAAMQGEASLAQNTPNPFTGETTIRMFVPQEAKSAVLGIYDLTGKPVMQLTIPSRGNTSATLSSATIS